MTGQIVLVVDDDEELRTMVASTLAFSGYTVMQASDAATAFRAMSETAPDAIVLDVMMPDADGFDVVQVLRHRGSLTPVLFLSARDSVEDRVRGLTLGGDDYLTKPFRTVELLARIQALLRRATATAAGAGSEGALRVADLELDEEYHRVSRAGHGIDLSPTEFRLLQLLMENDGRVLSKTQILEAVWQYDFGGDTNVVERFISNLRRKIDDGHTPLITTVRGFGYSIRSSPS
ncbi:response regulator transcription factor [Microbacterium sp. T2.11-28]|uniref:response regulator transcription factor n=1 Tax=unclassified Microbacterium TaxID=2609290 RepID=UPI00247748AA|nr:response regulator transcription factor [Microbacterium sp. T2.11-28]CAI9390846.1 putative transcriptional regulatory protein TcrX [Microbacterium sp. T2.11-28]